MLFSKLPSRLKVIHEVFCSAKRQIHAISKLKLEIPHYDSLSEKEVVAPFILIDIAKRLQSRNLSPVPEVAKAVGRFVDKKRAANSGRNSSEKLYLKQTPSYKPDLFHKPFDDNVFHFKLDENAGKIVIQNTSGSSPYDVYNYTYKESNVQRDKINNGFDKRLSVTGLLPQRWCELKDYYQIYSRFQKPVSSKMKQGISKHSALELESHPVDEDLMVRLSSIQLDRESAVDNYAQVIFEALTRLLDLFLHGNARELKIHGFLDRSTGSFLNPNMYKNYQGDAFQLDHSKINNNYILVTGVIDHLFFSQFEDYSEYWKNAKGIEELIDTIHSFNGVYDGLIVGDVKVRYHRALPKQKSVVDSAKLQVGIYRKMLELLASQGLSLELLVETARRHAIDIDAPVHPKVALMFSEQFPLLVPTFENLANGSLTIPGKEETSNPLELYDLTSYNDSGILRGALPMSSSLFTQWQKPLTVRHIIYWYAQLLECLNGAFSSKLMVEYYHQDENFENVEFAYNEERVQKEVKSSLEFWLGMRPPEPIDPTYANFNTYCKYCEFRNYCHWKNHFYML